MARSTPSPFPTATTLCTLALAASLLSGCAVVTIAGAAVGVAATGVGIAADATVGAVKLTGKAVGAVLPGGEDE